MISIQVSDDTSMSAAADEMFAYEPLMVVIAPSAEGVRSVAPVENVASATSTDSKVVYPSDFHLTRWSPYLETVFQDLVSKRAAGELTSADKVRLARIRSERQRLKNPISSELILWDYKAQQLRTKALETLREYVEFIEAPPSGSKARR